MTTQDQQPVMVVPPEMPGAPWQSPETPLTAQEPGECPPQQEGAILPGTASRLETT